MNLVALLYGFRVSLLFVSIKPVVITPILVTVHLFLPLSVAFFYLILKQNLSSLSFTQSNSLFLVFLLVLQSVVILSLIHILIIFLIDCCLFYSSTHNLLHACCLLFTTSWFCNTHTTFVGYFSRESYR